MTLQSSYISRQHRPRRLRLNAAIRDAFSESFVHPKHLIQPMFIIPGKNKKQDIPSMPGISRRSIDLSCAYIKQCLKVGVNHFAIFPVIDAQLKSASAEESFNPQGLIQQAISECKNACPEAVIISDVALDPYTSHGHDGIIDDSGYILNDPTIEILIQQALSHARAGADIVAPSDMMDHRIGKIRFALDQEGWTNTLIMSYCVKFASNFYGPFRDAVGSADQLKGKDKNQYQMAFTNSRDSLIEAQLDIQEGADILMVKPGMPYLDIIHRLSQQFSSPIAAYQVSGEYSMLKWALDNQVLPKNALHESLISFRRSGCQAILTYFAKQYAESL